MSKPEPKFKIDEVAILQPPHPSARSYWGMETTVINVIWSENVEDAVHGLHPPLTDLPEDQHDGGIWSEYDLKKKYEPGQDFADLVDELKEISVTV